MWYHVPKASPPACDIRIAGFCSGVGMLERAAILAFDALGFRARCVCHVEREVVAASLLVGLGEASGDEAPCWDDLGTFDGRPWRGVVDLCVAGLPCPSFSSAGKRGGNADARAFGEDGDGPQAHMLRIISEMRPAMAFFENVGEWVTGGYFR